MALHNLGGLSVFVTILPNCFALPPLVYSTLLSSRRSCSTREIYDSQVRSVALCPVCTIVFFLS